MGLLVAGIMGGSSLIQSAKIRATVNEYYEYKTAYNSYYARYGKVPGEDSNTPGWIKKDTGFKDLCDKGFINQECIEVNSDTYVIFSKLGNKVIWDLRGWDNSFLGEDCLNSNLILIGTTWTIPNIGTANRLTYKEAYAIESKIDDGEPDSGIGRVASTNGDLK